jgi:hypothetical protein
MSVRRPNPFVSIALLAALIFGTGGCTMIAVGAVGALGGYAISRDTFEGITSKGMDEIWEAATRVASIMGTIDDNDRKRGQMIARINGAKVVITATPVNLTNTKLRIKARKMLFPAVDIAQNVYAKIISQTEQ